MFTQLLSILFAQVSHCVFNCAMNHDDSNCIIAPNLSLHPQINMETLCGPFFAMAAKAAARAAEQAKKQQQDKRLRNPRSPVVPASGGLRSGQTRRWLVHAGGSRLRRRVQQRANLFRPGLAVRTSRRDGTLC